MPQSKFDASVQAAEVTNRSLADQMARITRAAARRGGGDLTNDKERVAGFTEGGASTEVSAEEEKDAAAQMAMLQEERNKITIDTSDEAIGVSPAGGPEEEETVSVLESDSQDPEALAEEVVAKYAELGFKAEASVSEGGEIKVDVKMPKGFEKEDPLAMSPERLQEAQAAQGVESAEEPEASSPDKEKEGKAEEKESPVKERGATEEPDQEKEEESKEEPEEEISAHAHFNKKTEADLGDVEKEEVAKKEGSDKKPEKDSKKAAEEKSGDKKKPIVGRFTEMVQNRDQSGAEKGAGGRGA